MLLPALRVIHVRKRAVEESDLTTALALLEPLLPEAFGLDTCQRRIWVFASFMGGPSGLSRRIPGVDFHSGADAYRFLLQVSTGLESEVRGETDVFGQIKQSWAAFEEGGSALAEALGPWIQRLFEDTKDIRSRFLRNLGGASYGSLVRKLIRGNEGSALEPVLILGSGQIAKSIAPWLAENRLWIWNRSERGLAPLESELRAKAPGADFEVLRGPESEERALREAAHCVVCIPPDRESDERRIRLWLEGNRVNGVPRTLIHLGALRSALSAWTRIPGFHALDEIFALQKQANESRAGQFARAERACFDRARLRALPGSLAGSTTLPHGWEDLAVFA